MNLTREETIKLIGVIVMAYPNFDKFKDESHIRSMVNVWADFFADDDGGIVALAVKKHISTSKWPPSIAEIREIIVDITCPDIVLPEEAWAMVSKLLYVAGEYKHENIRETLPAIIADAVEAVGYHTLLQHKRKHDGYDRVAFLQAYGDRMEQRKKHAQMPKTLRCQIDAACDRYDNGSREMSERLNERYAEKQRRIDFIGCNANLELEMPRTSLQLTERFEREENGYEE